MCRKPNDYLGLKNVNASLTRIRAHSPKALFSAVRFRPSLKRLQNQHVARAQFARLNAESLPTLCITALLIIELLYNLVHLVRQVLVAWMVIAHEHLRVSVTGDFGQVEQAVFQSQT